MPDVDTPRQLPDPRVRVLAVVAALLVVALVVRSVDPFGWFDPDDGSVAAAGDVTLLEIREAAELTSATGRFSVPVVIDVSRTGLRERLPEFVDREQIVALYQGDVNATIDLRGLTAEGVIADPEARTITVRVPEPKLSPPRIDHSRSQIVSHQRGVLQRLEDALGEGSLAVKDDLDRAAVAAIAKAAAESDLKDTARANGTRFLTLLCQGLGYTDVTIEYAEPGR